MEQNKKNYSFRQCSFNHFYSSSLPQSAVKLEVIKGVLSDGYTGHYFLFKTFYCFCNLGFCIVKWNYVWMGKIIVFYYTFLYQ